MALFLNHFRIITKYVKLFINKFKEMLCRKSIMQRISFHFHPSELM